MKIIRKDNYGQDNVSNKLIAENVSDYMGNKIVNCLNNTWDRDPADWYSLEADDYKLYDAYQGIP